MDNTLLTKNTFNACLPLIFNTTFENTQQQNI